MLTDFRGATAPDYFPVPAPDYFPVPAPGEVFQQNYITTVLCILFFKGTVSRNYYT